MLAAKGTLDDCARSELNEINPTLGKSSAFSVLQSLGLMTRGFYAASATYSTLSSASPRSAMGAPPASSVSLLKPVLFKYFV